MGNNLNKIKITIPEIAEKDRTPLVESLMAVIGQLVVVVQTQAEEIEQLKTEVARLKGQSPRPRIEPSKLGSGSGGNISKSNNDKRPGSDKRSKTQKLVIHRLKQIAPNNIPAGSKFKGYQKRTVQDIIIKPHNTLYLLERWRTPDGKNLIGEMPKEIGASHFGPILNAYIVQLSAQMRATQPLILEHLRDIGVDISSGQIDCILNKWGQMLQPEREQILKVGLAVSSYIQADDTGARHKGINGACTHIGSELFTYFASTNSKSRINFIEQLQGNQRGYLLNDFSRNYLKRFKITQIALQKLPWGRTFPDKSSWEEYCKQHCITLRLREITEAAMLGYAVKNGLREDLLILSDDAGQFDIFNHALCWYHAERPLKKLIPLTPSNENDLNRVNSEFWELYQELKQFKTNPLKQNKAKIEKHFDKIVSQNTSFHCLNLFLKTLAKNKNELLMVLDHPQLPLHNNGSEREIREYVTKRKVSAGTRSNSGRSARDSFLSVKKTLRKLNLSFWRFLLDKAFAHLSDNFVASQIMHTASLTPA